MRKSSSKNSNSKSKNDEYYTQKGYTEEDLNLRGKPKRGLVSFQIEEKLWRAFDKKVEQQYGRYKKSYIIESLIREYMSSLESRYSNSSEQNNNAA